MIDTVQRDRYTDRQKVSYAQKMEPVSLADILCARALKSRYKKMREKMRRDATLLTRKIGFILRMNVFF